MAKDEDKPRRYAFRLTEDGEADLERLSPLDGPDPVPAEDGRYYLEQSTKAVRLAIELAEQGIETYCARCKAPLKATKYFVICTKNQNHFRVHISRRD